MSETTQEPPDPTRNPRRLRRRLGLTAVVLVGLVAVVGAGTFASFNVASKNPGNQFADGTLVLSNTKDSGTACLSTGGGTTDVNANNACEQLFGLSVRKPGDSSSTNVTIRNEGSLPASALKVFSAACANADVATETYHGTGNPCAQIQLTIQRYTNSSFTTPAECVYGGGNGTTCDFSDATKTLAAFQSAYGSSGAGKAIGSGLASGASSYLKVSVLLPAGSDNSFQGRQATADLTWYAEQ